MCHIGSIAVDVLAHGIRFPLLVYAPVEYNNGSFFSGLLTAVSFSVLGRNVLTLKLLTFLVSIAGAVATLWLLRGCLRRARGDQSLGTRGGNHRPGDRHRPGASSGDGGIPLHDRLRQPR